MGMQLVQGTKEKHTGFWQGKQMERDQTQDLGVN